MQPQEISDALAAFPGSVRHLMPKMEDIPQEFHRGYNKWCDLQTTWFYKGLKGAKFHPKEGIDTDKALRHLGAIQGSFEPSHEHKSAAVAYLMSEWFTDIELPKEKKRQHAQR